MEFSLLLETIVLSAITVELYSLARHVKIERKVEEHMELLDEHMELLDEHIKHLVAALDKHLSPNQSYTQNKAE